MLGIPDFWIWLPYILCIVSAAVCLGYGVYNWNKGAENEDEQIQEESIWEKSEQEVDAKL